MRTTFFLRKSYSTSWQDHKIKKKMIKENIQDLSAFGGVPIFIILIVISIILKEFTLTKQLILGIILSYILIFGIRSFYFKTRPDKTKYKNYFEKVDASSFPSAHTMRSVILVIILRNFMQDNLVFILLILISLGVSISRVYLKRHFLSDVIGGLILGIISGISIIKYIS